MNIYQENGYLDRKQYLNSIAESYGVSHLVVYDLANLLGQEEDFDGLLNSIEDYILMIEDNYGNNL